MHRKAMTLAALALGFLIEPVAQAAVSIIIPQPPAPLEKLAAYEVQRYVYQRSGQLLAVSAEDSPQPAGNIVIARKDRAVVAGLGATNLGPQHYLVKTTTTGERKTVWIVGGDDTGTLYAGYRFAERLGVRYYLHGDVLPDEQVPFALPELNETGRPLFELRGLLPFHDFPEGPDWWELDDYLTHLSQMAKLGMNFIGFHCYPERGRGPEPAVWIGLPGDFDAQGRVSYCYPVQWANTARDRMWGFAAMDTYDFAGGASRLFPADLFGPSVMAGAMPHPTTFEQGNRVFNETAALFRSAFTHARALGVKTCLGTETPLTIPLMMRQKLARQNQNPEDPAVVRSVYEALFRRITAAHPLDYYWLWTPETWTWGGSEPEEVAMVERDVRAALAALKAVGQPFTLATCGWVLGPQNNRGALDHLLPPNSPMGCINREVGHSTVEPMFAGLSARPKWAMPWLENDWSLTTPQLWAGRMRYDAADARRLSCAGLFGLHWRTKAMAPNIAALAAAAWDQSWVPTHFDQTPVKATAKMVETPESMMIGFRTPVAGTDDPVPYGSMRVNVDAYRLDVPNGEYSVTLKFNEGEWDRKGMRVFDVKLQGKTVVENLDIFARAGRNKALDLIYPGIRVTDEKLRIDFVPHKGTNLIAAIVVEGTIAATGDQPSAPYALKLNCGGLRHNDYDQDLFVERLPDWNLRRSMPVEAFYVDFARANFGAAVAEAVGRVFTRLDGASLPAPTSWNAGPGAISPNLIPWGHAKAKYAFVEELVKLRASIQGAGNLERFDYWLNSFRAMSALAEVGCIRGELDRKMTVLMPEKDPAKRKALAQEGVEIRLRLARGWEKMLWYQLAATDTSGELGMLSDLEQHNRRFLGFLNLYDPELAVTLGEVLPTAAQPAQHYSGPGRLIVPTVRNQAAPGESLNLKVMLLDNQPARSLTLFWRPLGQGDFRKVELKNQARQVYQGNLPPAESSFEYYLEATTSADQKLLWPATAPKLNQSVVVCAVL